MMLTDEERLSLLMAVSPVRRAPELISGVEFSDLYAQVHKIETVDDLIVFIYKVIRDFDDRVEQIRAAYGSEW